MQRLNLEYQAIGDHRVANIEIHALVR